MLLTDGRIEDYNQLMAAPVETYLIALNLWVKKIKAVPKPKTNSRKKR